MSRTVIVTPCFAKSTMLAGLLEHVYKDPIGAPNLAHYILGNHYPVNKGANHEEIRTLAKRYGCTLIDSGSDLGLHKSLNNFVSVAGITSEDVVIGCDPDDRPTPGFATALADVMRADPSLAIAAANFWRIDEVLSTCPNPWLKQVSGHQVWIHPSVEMWNVCAWNMRLIHDVGGFHQPNSHYGGIEIGIAGAMRAKGMKLGYVLDVRSDAAVVDHGDARLIDPEYRRWKIDHATKGFAGSLADWLKINAPEKLT